MGRRPIEPGRERVAALVNRGTHIFALAHVGSLNPKLEGEFREISKELREMPADLRRDPHVRGMMRVWAGNGSRPVPPP